ncbi:VWA domain-containing protein [Atopobacter phocae]|uniref:VWA domain-containing protein n=1 Tax=Atopobacter phocae TaxID=136492 RepID=UPI000470AA52|nr:VWA domain-containing protein [Atopobacter phocae]
MKNKRSSNRLKLSKNTRRYTLRKLAIGLVSFGAGSFILSTTPVVMAAETASPAITAPAPVETETTADDTTIVLPQATAVDATEVKDTELQTNNEEPTAENVTSSTEGSEAEEKQNKAEETTGEESHKKPVVESAEENTQTKIGAINKKITRTTDENGNVIYEVETIVDPEKMEFGSDVSVLLDTSNIMGKDNRLEKAKESIKKLADVLLDNENNLHRMQLMTFNSKFTTLVEFTSNKQKILDALDKVKEVGHFVDGAFTQGAIHEALKDFKEIQDKKQPHKEQHIVLLTHGKANYSYGVNKENLENILPIDDVKEVTDTRYLFNLIPYQTTHKSHYVIEDAEKLGAFFNIKFPSYLTGGLGKLASYAFPQLNYIRLKETKDTEEDVYDYNTKIGEGTHIHSLGKQMKDGKPSGTVTKKIMEKISPNSPFKWLSKQGSFFKNIIKDNDPYDDAAQKLIETVTQPRKIIYYNHINNAISEARLAQKAGIHIHAININNSETKYDRLIKRMSSDGKFFDIMNSKDEDIRSRFTLNNIEIKDILPDDAKLIKDSLTQTVGNSEYTPMSTTLIFWKNPANVTWKLNKDDFSKKPVKMTYKLSVSDVNNTIDSKLTYKVFNKDKEEQIKVPKLTDLKVQEQPQQPIEPQGQDVPKKEDEQQAPPVHEDDKKPTPEVVPPVKEQPQDNGNNQPELENNGSMDKPNDSGQEDLNHDNAGKNESEKTPELSQTPAPKPKEENLGKGEHQEPKKDMPKESKPLPKKPEVSPKKDEPKQEVPKQEVPKQEVPKKEKPNKETQNDGKDALNKHQAPEKAPKVEKHEDAKDEKEQPKVEEMPKKDQPKHEEKAEDQNKGQTSTPSNTQQATLPQTGEGSHYALASLALIEGLGLGIRSTKTKEQEN